MNTTGTITLPNGTTVMVGQGGCYCIGSDRYPITVVGWSASGKTLYYRRARAHATKASNPFGMQSYVFTENPDAPVRTATWRRKDKRFRPKGSKWASIHTNGYDAYTDPSF